MNGTRFQFGLRDLFWLMLVFSVVAGWWHGSLQDREAEIRIQKLERTVLELDAKEKLRSIAKQNFQESFSRSNLDKYLD